MLKGQYRYLLSLIIAISIIKSTIPRSSYNCLLLWQCLQERSKHSLLNNEQFQVFFDICQKSEAFFHPRKKRTRSAWSIFTTTIKEYYCIKTTYTTNTAAKRPTEYNSWGIRWCRWWFFCGLQIDLCNETALLFGFRRFQNSKSKGSHRDENGSCWVNPKCFNKDSHSRCTCYRYTPDWTQSSSCRRVWIFQQGPLVRHGCTKFVNM